MSIALTCGLILVAMWLATSLTVFLAPQNQLERDMDDADQVAYLKEYARKHRKEA